MDQNSGFILDGVYLPIMEHTTTISCPHCSSSDLCKNGHSENGTQRWLCNGCKKSFQLSYTPSSMKRRLKSYLFGYRFSFSKLLPFGSKYWDINSVGLECHLDRVEVTGSNPVCPTI